MAMRKPAKTTSTWAHKKAQINAAKRAISQAGKALVGAQKALAQAQKTLTDIVKSAPGGPPKNNTGEQPDP